MIDSTFGRPLVGMLFMLAAVQGAAAQPALQATQAQQLRQLEASHRAQFQLEHLAAQLWAQEHGRPMREVHADGRVTALMSLRDGRPHAYTTLNAAAADSNSTDELLVGGSSGLDLDGSGVLLHQWDGGEVRLTHLEFAGAVNWADDTTYGDSDHSTHVAGTLIANGLAPSAKGMSPGATLDAYDFYDDNAEMTAASLAGALVSNHSYGFVRGWRQSGPDWYWYGTPSISTTEDASFGFYDSWSNAWDAISYAAPYYLICKSAGNDRNDSHVGGHYVWIGGGWTWSTDARDADGGVTGYDSIGQQACAKNILTVGAVYDIIGGWTDPADVVMSTFSGWGPTDDGRIKPDIVANGISLYSSSMYGDSSYAFKSGTSMAAPSTAGSLGLLIEHYRATHASADMRSATLKGLVIHTADEAGANPGPDYSFGWGQINMLAAADHITLDQTWSGAIQELNLADGQTIEQEWISDGGGPMKATICWTDLPGTPVPLSLDPPNRMLVNDLDLRIIGPDAAVYEPWILDPANPADAATTGNNDRDNVEVVLLDPAPGGRYTIQISHAGALSGGSQNFALILSVGSGAPSACPADEVEDCFGNCAPVDWIGDGYCDDGSYSYEGNPIDFNCSEFAFDGGDCAASPVAYILWRHQGSGNNTVWMMNGSTIEPGSGPMQTLADTDWTLCGMGDFNGDGEAYDLLWRHAVNGKNTIWLMHGRSILPDSGSLTKVADMDWIIAGTGDFNGDGKADILWRHLGTGKNVVW
ncbi:MAG: S8 family serine peptidase, partial [Planctomycetota bacterium]